jgi:GNAT superfamily N-acetyltransferase
MQNLEDQGHGRYVLQAWAARNSVNPADYIVVDTTQYADANQIPTIDIDLEPAPAPQQPGMGQWNGQWKVLVGGQEVYRFGGVGNSQADANRIAAAWLRQNGQGVSGEGFEVYPVMAESLTESNNLHLRDFVVTISPHALEQCYNRNIDPDQVDDILKNISQAKSSIMGQEPGVPFILHDGQGTALGMRRQPDNRLTLATVYKTSSDFVKGKYATFKIAANKVEEGQDRFGNFDPPGPETPPTMPAGTVKVDVSDVYDWYKLGQHISNMKGLGQHDFGKGPPSAILSFGDEDLEHQYIQALKKTGLTTTDIDPVDPKQPPGMPRQKTDPTYNVDENFADGENPVKFTVSSPDGYQHSFQITLAVHGKHVGHFNFVRSADTDDVNNEAEVEQRWQGQGYGKLLLMKAIDVANNHGLDFQQDIRGITDAQQNVYDSLENAGLIVTPGDGFWFLTPQGEQELNGLNENFADGKNPGRKGLAKRVGVNTKASVSDLRKTAKNSSGEKQRMAHWLANMKAGRAKAKRK